MKLNAGLGAGVVVALAACAAPEETTTGASALDGRAYAFELQARASEDPADATFAVPAGAQLKNLTPRLNDRGDVAIAFRAADGLPHVWKNGAVVHDVADEKAVVGDVAINAGGDVAFAVVEASAANGIWLYRDASHQASFATSEPLGADGWTSVSLSDAGKIGCRAGTGGVHFLGFPDEKGFTRLAVEAAASPNSKYAYLFSPAFDGHDRAASKVQLVSGGNELRVFAQGAMAITLAQDATANPASSFVSFDNGVALNDAGALAFIAKVGVQRGVYRTDGTTTSVIAREGAGGVGKIAFFTPVMNASGVVVFKGEDDAGRNAIWVGDGNTLTRLVTAGDALPSDRGEATPLPETDTDPSNRVAFGGGLAINARGDVAFVAALAQRGAGQTPVDQRTVEQRSGETHNRLGTAVYVARARR